MPLSMRKTTCALPVNQMLLPNGRRFSHRLWQSLSQFTTSLRPQYIQACVQVRRSARAGQIARPWRAYYQVNMVCVCRYSTLVRRSRLMSQYDKLKEQYKDYILLFQVGDFYELYGEDASKLLCLLFVQYCVPGSPIPSLIALL